MKKLLKLLLLLLSLILLVTFASCAPEESADYPAQENGSEHIEREGFYVDGKVLRDINGIAFVMRGVNYPHTWFKDKLVTALPAIAETGSNTVRIVLSNGAQWSKDSAQSVERIINMCKELEMIAVLEVHDATGSNRVSDLMKAVDYWIEIKDVLIGNEAYVIVNIANEWYGNWSSEAWRDGYAEAVPKLREAGIRNTLMIDAAGWGQYAKSIHELGLEVFEADELANTMFSVHMYENAGKDRNTVMENIGRVTRLNVPVVVGEFGHKHHDSDVAFLDILSHSDKEQVGYLGWSWKGNSGGVEYLDIALEWDGSKLSEDWGEILINSEFGIRNTSVKCSVFEGE